MLALMANRGRRPLGRVVDDDCRRAHSQGGHLGVSSSQVGVDGGGSALRPASAGAARSSVSRGSPLHASVLRLALRLGSVIEALEGALALWGLGKLELDG